MIFLNGIFYIFAAFFPASVFVIITGIFAVKSASFAAENTSYLIMPITTETCDAELILRQAVCITNRSDMNIKIIVIDLGANAETLEICRKFSDTYGVFEIC